MRPPPSLRRDDGNSARTAAAPGVRLTRLPQTAVRFHETAASATQRGATNPQSCRQRHVKSSVPQREHHGRGHDACRDGLQPRTGTAGVMQLQACTAPGRGTGQSETGRRLKRGQGMTAAPLAETDREAAAHAVCTEGASAARCTRNPLEQVALQSKGTAPKPAPALAFSISP